MSAVVYLRIEEENQPATTMIVCAKTKVAPIKRMTIPRLELTAAVMLTTLVAAAQRMLELNQAEIHLWTDSAVTLAWIKSHPSRWKDYVHNRVTKIRDTLPAASWRHINGKDNATDCASRGISSQEIANHQLWWSAPVWMNKEPGLLTYTQIGTPSETLIEARPSPAYPVGIQVQALAEILKRYSTLSKVLQVTAIMNRAIDRIRRQPTPQTPVLTCQELNEARLLWIKITHKQYFSAAHRLLERDNQLSISRLGGLLKNSLLNREEIQPIILPRKSRLITLVIEEAHRRTLHGGSQLTLAETRQRYCILGGKNTVKAYILRCVVCGRHRGRQAQQLMGQLPTARVTPSRAFLHTGVDYAGPFPILKGRPTKAAPSTVSIAVFVCFTSAVYLGVVSRQTTEAFLATYKRFSPRRGIPEIIYSDNATTFEGAAHELSRLYNDPTRKIQQIQAALATNGTQWKLIPPRSPHFGGKWEATVKSLKHHLKRTVGSSTYTSEELNTIVIQIEAGLNSRLITPMSDDRDDLQALTPGQFLIDERIPADYKDGN